MGTGRIHSVLIAADGTLYGWGQWTGGNDTVFYSPVARLMPGAGAWTWRQVAAGNDYTLAIRQDGTLWAWGGNGGGSLGDGTHTSRYWPVQVGHANDWLRISAYNISLGVRADGTLWAWGSSKDGVLGLDTLSQSNVPRQVGTATNWTDAVTGWSHCVGVRADGTLWAWGDNRAGWFAADSTVIHQRTPRQVGTDTTWVTAAVGWYHTAALRTNGTLWTWGRNHFGMLANGTRRGSRTPGQVGTATNWRQVSAGGQHTMALRADSSLWAWGKDDENWLGIDWDYIRRAGPVADPPGPFISVLAAGEYWNSLTRALPIDSTHTWLAVASTSEHKLGVRADGSVWAWGSPLNGRLGTPGRYATPTSPRPDRVPERVPSLLALLSPPAPAPAKLLPAPAPRRRWLHLFRPQYLARRLNWPLLSTRSPRRAGAR